MEPSLEALNVKKFDLAFAVDPLFHKTSAQFDEGGAKGLLLNNLSVYRGCEIVFDSMDVPDVDLELSGAESTGMATSSVALDALISRDLENGSLHSNNLKQISSPPPSPIAPTLDTILAMLKNVEPNSLENAESFSQESVQAFVDQVASGQFVNTTLEDGADDQTGFTEALISEVDSLAAILDVPSESNPHQAALPTAEEVDDDHSPNLWDGGPSSWDDGEMSVDVHIHDHGKPGQRAKSGKHTQALDDDAISWLIAASAAPEGGENGNAHAPPTFLTAAKGWAGTSHWKYRQTVMHKQGAVGGEDSSFLDDDGEGNNNDEGNQGAKGPKRRGRVAKKNQPIDFVALMDAGDKPSGKKTATAEGPSIPLLPQPKKLPKYRSKQHSEHDTSQRRVTKTLLPEDYHCGLQMLTRYALRPRTTVQLLNANRHRRSSAGDGCDTDHYANQDDFSGFGIPDGYEHDEPSLQGTELQNSPFLHSETDQNHLVDGDNSGVEQLTERMTLLGLEAAQAAHKVEKVEVNYSRAAKQVDVKALKELMWSGMNKLVNNTSKHPDCVDFDQVLATVPLENPAGRLEDLSVHLCFICVLHLANEHGLQIQGSEGLDALNIRGIMASG